MHARIRVEITEEEQMENRLNAGETLAFRGFSREARRERGTTKATKDAQS
jgi:hypothetical protein